MLFVLSNPLELVTSVPSSVPAVLRAGSPIPLIQNWVGIDRIGVWGLGAPLWALDNEEVISAARLQACQVQQCSPLASREDSAELGQGCWEKGVLGMGH